MKSKGNREAPKNAAKSDKTKDSVSKSTTELKKDAVSAKNISTNNK